MDEDEPKRRGRPATGITPKRGVRIEDELWSEVERLASELARRDGTKVNVTAYIKDALVRQNARVVRLLGRAEQR
jgi:hypothetical protein